MHIEEQKLKKKYIEQDYPGSLKFGNWGSLKFGNWGSLKFGNWGSCGKFGSGEYGLLSWGTDGNSG